MQFRFQLRGLVGHGLELLRDPGRLQCRCRLPRLGAALRRLCPYGLQLRSERVDTPLLAVAVLLWLHRLSGPFIVSVGLDAQPAGTSAGPEAVVRVVSMQEPLLAVVRIRCAARPQVPGPDS
ncbi:hypothetical protein AOB60_27185 [Streptomyces noursei]|uniref:Uncharacterized protein n=1 Tax=Streptomyces noursei TaxID=1971 RepID=A0A2N8PA32_STRNR|nr:hypothetical protein AOB60_27185 [Streptomyces noursei]